MWTLMQIVKGGDLGGNFRKMRAKRLKMINIGIFLKGKGGHAPPAPSFSGVPGQ